MVPEWFPSMSSSSSRAPAIFVYSHAKAGAPLQHVAGVSLVTRAVITARQAGFRRVVVAVRPEDEAPVRNLLRALGEVELVVGNEQVVVAAPDGPGDQLVVLAGDAVWTHGALVRLAAPLDHGCDLRELIASDGLGGARPAAMRVRARVWRRGLAAAGVASWESMFEDEQIEGRVCAPIDRSCWHPLRRASDRRGAEYTLLRSLIEPTDDVIARTINRHISIAITRWLAPLPVRPNHVTFGVLIIGLAAAPLAYDGTYAGLVFGALCYYLAAVLDGVDGALSRLKYLGSPIGAWFDTVTDDVVGLAWGAGMFAGLARTATHPYIAKAWVWIGCVTVVCYLGMMVARYYLLATKAIASDHSQRTISGRGPSLDRMDPSVVRGIIFRSDFLPLYAVVSAVANVVPAFAIPFVAGAVAAFVDTIARLARTVIEPAAEASHNR